MDIGFWAEELSYAVTVCDKQGIILAMNRKACQNYADEGGAELIGKNVLDCHPPKARKVLEAMLASGQAFYYTSEKKGIKKFISQTPWYKQGEYAGIVEISQEIPADMPHFVRS